MDAMTPDTILAHGIESHNWRETSFDPDAVDLAALLAIHDSTTHKYADHDHEPAGCIGMVAQMGTGQPPERCGDPVVEGEAECRVHLRLRIAHESSRAEAARPPTPGACPLCDIRHGPRVTCSEAQHRIDGPEHAQMWEPAPPRMPITHPDRADDEWSMGG